HVQCTVIHDFRNNIVESLAANFFTASCPGFSPIRKRLVCPRFPSPVSVIPVIWIILRKPRDAGLARRAMRSTAALRADEIPAIEFPRFDTNRKQQAPRNRPGVAQDFL